jgi:hypothetical protein
LRWSKTCRSQPGRECCSAALDHDHTVNMTIWRLASTRRYRRGAPCWTTRNMLRASPSRSRVTRESQCSRQQRLDPRTALAERGPPGGAPRTGQRAAARFASYCARLMGSVIEGEDVVQDTLARALVALQDLEEAPPLRPSCSARSTCYAAARCAWLKNRATPTRTLSTQPSPTPW